MNESIEIKRGSKYYRLFEIFPGALTWLTFILPIVLSIFWPIYISDIIIIYAVYWLVKALIMSMRLIAAYKNFKKNVVLDWFAKCKKTYPNNWTSVYHMVILATYKEDIETLRYSIKALLESNYDLKKIIFVLATEERDIENVREISKKLKNDFGKSFFKFIISVHPMGTVGEVKGKGSNITYACKYAINEIKSEKISNENIIVTTLDADNRVHKEYLPCLAYNYLGTSKPINKSFQPLTMYFNNIWKVPIFIRSISVGGSFWQMIESTRPYRLRNFSAHAQGLEGLVKTNFWSTKTIVEDGHQYWRSYFAFDGKYDVVPLPIPVYQDAVLSPKGYWATFREQYIQKRRWAWGCSDIPYVMTNIIKRKNLPFYEKWMQAIRLIDGHLSWSTTSVILAVIGWIPSLVNAEFRHTVVAYTFPIVYSRILTVATLGLIVTLIMSTLLLPSKTSKNLTFSVILEWALSPFMLPISNIVFGSLAAIDAQTRLMFGKYLEFKVTEKAPYYD